MSALKKLPSPLLAVDLFKWSLNIGKSSDELRSNVDAVYEELVSKSAKLIRGVK